MIEADQVVKHFGDVHALNGITLSVDEGEIFGLLGPNGAGKTTLVRILATLLKPTSGRCTLGGIDPHRDPMAVRALIGLAGQNAAVDDLLTGRENLEIVGRLYQLDRAEARRRADDILERLSLTDAADRQVRTYSGGMRRRIDLGASLVGRPRILILDEPTTGLDPRTRNELWQLIRDLVSDGATVLLTTQYLEEADELADRLAVIDLGHIIAEGTPDELKERLGGDRLMASPTEPDDMARVVSILEQVGATAPYVDDRRQQASIPVTNRIEALLAAGQLFENEQIALRDLAVTRPSLDDVFLSITGKRAETDEPEPAAAGRKGRRR
ncbi:MAG: ATP-binding cassette domain-containing protein [Acidimicrobiia bacterium]|nr:ATP-binding cassette domain-containing protein [Acidimicrobiia bacterium]MDH5519248.1 ATP-binding cassette domain-containing protein [Acidimicrobiia bacterium]